MFFDQSPTLDLFARSILLGPILILWVIITVRFIGLRTFSKMTAFDFISTLAVGSLVASAATATTWAAFSQPAIAIVTILITQATLAHFLREKCILKDVLTNEPRLLFSNGTFLQEAMKECRISESALWAKMREANALDPNQIAAIVLETTGDISVLHGGEVDEQLLDGVQK